MLKGRYRPWKRRSTPKVSGPRERRGKPLWGRSHDARRGGRSRSRGVEVRSRPGIGMEHGSEVTRGYLGWQDRAMPDPNDDDDYDYDDFNPGPDE